MRKVGVEERRARLGVRHALATRVTTPEEAAAAVVALHATDPATVHLSIAARTRDIGVADVERALYEDRALMRLLGMRRTLFVAPDALAPVIQASSARAIAAALRKRYGKLISDAGLGDAEWLAGVEEATLAALRERGEAAGAELSAAVPELRSKVLVAEGKPYAAEQGITSWVLTLLGADGRIIRGRPRGSWLSSQYRWSPAERWLPGRMPELDVAAAQAELVRAWLAAFGPGTFDDLKWWTGWTVRDARAALAAVEAEEVDLGGATGLLLPGDAEPPGRPEPWVALLPGLDPTPMGWKERDWYLGVHAAQLFDTNGNVGPTVWSDGRIVGGWAQRSDGEVAFRLLEDIGAEATAAIEAEAARMADWIGEARVKPRFRTPLELELSE